MDKFEEKEMQFRAIMERCFKQFSAKNKHYGNDYFEGNYSEQERWMSVRRKIARLQAYYSGVSKDSLPDETLKDTWIDLMVYSVMELIILEGGIWNSLKKE